MSFEKEFITRISEYNEAYTFTCDADFKLLSVSRKLAEAQPDFQEGRRLRDILVHSSGIIEDARRNLEKGMPFLSTKFELLCQNMTLFLFPLNKDGQTALVLGCLDIQKEAVETLPVSEVVSSISDRYRTPISNVLNILSMLARKFQSAEDYKGLDYLNEAARHCYDMLRASTSVHDYFLLVNRKAPFHPEPILLNEFLLDLCNTLRMLFRNTEYQLVESICEEFVTVQADSRLLNLALLHLIRNACSYSPRDSRITLSLSLRNDTASIRIMDEGSGISRENISRIFEPFFVQQDIPVPEEEMGLGLGLPIAKEIAALHHGNLYISSEQNKGTTVAMTLPLSRETENGKFLRSDSVKYVTDRFSDLYILFTNICNIKLY